MLEIYGWEFIERIGFQSVEKLDQDLKKLYSTICLNMSLEQRGLELNFVGNKEIRDINRKYRQKDEVTDVLSFSFLNSQIKLDLMGFVCISYEYLSIEVKSKFEVGLFMENRWCFRDADQSLFRLLMDYEVKRMFVHGMLHVLGYKHSEEMFNLELKFLSLS